MSEQPKMCYAQIVATICFDCGGWSIPDVNELIERIVKTIEKEQGTSIQHINLGVSEE